MSKTAVMPLNDYASACDKIREKTETTDLIKSGELPEKINDVYESGVIAGKTQENIDFWNMVTTNNTKNDYFYGFYYWNTEYLRPPYIIKPTGMQSLAMTFGYNKSLKKIESRYFDFSNKMRGTYDGIGIYYTFCRCTVLEEIEDIGLQPDISLTQTFTGCWKLKKIACIRVDENTKYTDVFTGCGRLEDVTFEGVIGQNGLSFGNSPLLTKESLLSVINRLKDFRETVVEDCGVNVSMPCILTVNTLVEGVKYYLTYEGDNFEPYTAEAMAGQVTVMPSGISTLGLEFEMPSQTSGDIPLIWVYQDGENLMYDAYFSGISNAKITLSKAPTETHSITFGASNLAKLTDAEKAVATQKGWTLL